MRLVVFIRTRLVIFGGYTKLLKNLSQTGIDTGDWRRRDARRSTRLRRRGRNVRFNFWNISECRRQVYRNFRRTRVILR